MFTLSFNSSWTVGISITGHEIALFVPKLFRFTVRFRSKLHLYFYFDFGNLCLLLYIKNRMIFRYSLIGFLFGHRRWNVCQSSPERNVLINGNPCTITEGYYCYCRTKLFRAHQRLGRCKYGYRLHSLTHLGEEKYTFRDTYHLEPCTQENVAKQAALKLSLNS